MHKVAYSRLQIAMPFYIPQGKAITISAKAGKEAMDVGVIVNDETVIKVKGKKAALSDIKVGDAVKIRYLRSNDLYAKEIVKK
jgi:hypothetical protein